MPATGKVTTVGVLLFPGFEMLDVYGPLEMLSLTAAASDGVFRYDIKMLGHTAEVAASGGPATKTDYTYDDPAVPHLDMLLVPGGMGSRAVQDPSTRDDAYLAFLKTRAEAATTVTTVCTGAMLLAQTGLLDDRVATTNKKSFTDMVARSPKGVKWEHKARWCVDGKYWTSSGVSAGTDMFLTLIAAQCGEPIAQRTADFGEYFWTEENKDPRNDPAALLYPYPPVHTTVGVLLFPGFEMLDVYGPLEMLALAGVASPDVKYTVLMLGHTAEVAASGGPATKTDYTYDDPAVPHLDMLLVPGGMGSRAVQDPSTRDDAYLAFLKTRAEAATTVTTVCTGAMLLAQTGLLDNRVATTNKKSFADMVARSPKSVKWEHKARWCVDGKYWTSSGVSAGTDMYVALVQAQTTEYVAVQATKMGEYEWHNDPSDDPFADLYPYPPAVSGAQCVGL